MLLDPDIVALFFRLHYKVRNLPDLCHHTLSCLTQLASLNGPLVSSKDVRVKYVSHYLTQFLTLVSSGELTAQEALGLSAAFRKLTLFNPVDTLSSLNADLLQTFLLHCTRLTCHFAETAEREDASARSEENLHMEAFDNMLIGWDSIGICS